MKCAKMRKEACTSVPDFYAGKSVLITGAAGFLGKVLLEKLLYSCPKVENVYVLLRDKNNVCASQRLKTVLELPIFSRMRQERPQDLKKIVVMKGDITVNNLNLRKEDLETVLEKVSVVFHSAAAIKFNDPLKTALQTNLEGTHNIINLCQQMKNLQAFVHISTAYSNTDKPVIEEIVYPPPAQISEVYKFVEQENPDEATINKFLNGRPNTYTFTKALAEHLISETHGDIPAVIIRPSIVTPSKEEPVKGWVDNWFGATSLLTFISLGLCRAVYTSDDHLLDVIPVDYVCNLSLVAAAKAKRQPEVSVYNSCSGSTNPITARQLVGLFCDAAVKDGFNQLPHPKFMICTKRYWLVKLITLVTFVIASASDLLIRLTFKKPRFTKLVYKMKMVQEALEFFTTNSWNLKTEKVQALYESLSPSDARLFPCLASDIDWEEYVPTYYDGVQKYLVANKISSL